MKKGMYPGTFDPITVGHLDIIKRAAKLVDKLYVAILTNPKKSCTFSLAERKKFLEICCKELNNVEIVTGDKLTVQLATELGCNILIRGIRAVVDYEYELALATSNMRINPNIETVFLVSKPEYSFLSSSIAKEIASFGGNINGFIPVCIQRDVIKRLS